MPFAYYARLNRAQPRVAAPGAMQRIVHEPQRPLGSKNRGFVLRQQAVRFKLFKPFQNFLNLVEIVAVIIDSRVGIARGRIHFHAYHVGLVVLRIQLALAHVATVVNHLANNPFLIRAWSKSNGDRVSFMVVRIERGEQAQPLKISKISARH